MTVNLNYSVPLAQFIPTSVLPLERITPTEDVINLFSRILVTNYEERVTSTSGAIDVSFSIEQEAVFELPGLEGISLILGGVDAKTLTFSIEFINNAWTISLAGGVRLRFSRDWLHPVIYEGNRWVDDVARQYAEVAISAGIKIDSEWSVEVIGANEFHLAPVMISDSGLVIEGSLALDLSENSSLPETLAMGLGISWRGAVFKALTLHLPEEMDVSVLPTELQLQNFHIGNGGIAGSITGHWEPQVHRMDITGSGSGTLFGIPFGLRQLKIGLIQNSLTEVAITGLLGLPFFNQPIGVDIGLSLKGSLTMALSANQPEGVIYDAGLITFEKVDLLRFKLESMRFALDNGVFTATLGGQLTPLVGKDQGMDWPTFQVNELSITSDGDVRLAGGWLDLPSQYCLDFYGFKFEVTKLGFGKTEDGGKWIGFSGGLKLVEGMQAGASVEGLRVTWHENETGEIDTKVTLNGVGVEFEIAEVLYFKGAVAYRELPDEEHPGRTIHRFDGAIKLKLTALDLEIDGMLVIGKTSEYTFFAIYLDVELPTGIPLGNTSLSLYGFAGLFALNMEPNKKPDEAWYGVGEGDGWFKRPEIGVTDLIHKWTNRQDSLAFGAGVTLGTASDNGYIFSGKMLLVIVFPGPIIMLEGKANLLRNED